jgi:hypothetical protein
MTKEELIQYYPRAYHMAEANTWDSIRRYGLLSTTALLDLFEIKGEERYRLESERRSECVTIRHPVHGTAVIRDQKPMSEKALSKCLQGATPRQWYELLNRRTFFWLNPDRLSRLLSARAYRDRPHCVITVDTRKLVEERADRVTLCPINSGSTIMSAPSRSPGSFYPIDGYPFDQWRQCRGKRNAIAELAVEYAVSNIAEATLVVEHRQREQVLEAIWRGGA